MVVKLALISLLVISGKNADVKKCTNGGDFSNLLASNASHADRVVACERALCVYHQEGFDYVLDEFKKLCQKNENNFLSVDECLAILDAKKDDARGILADLQVSDSDACKYFLHYGKTDSPVYNWNFNINSSVYPEKTFTIVEPFSVLHLTDIHVSSQYAVGSSFDCNENMCCSDRQITNETSAQKSAGPYGDIRGWSKCNIPMRTLKSLLKSTEEKEFNYVYLTGDFIPHTVFGYSPDRVISEIEEQTKVISNALNGKIIIPSIGNHDIYPSGMLPTHSMKNGNGSVTEFYNSLWTLWGGKWVPEKEETNFKQGGYFAISPQPGLRIFSLNTVYCYKHNSWLTVDPEDPEKQLSWLSTNLEQSAQKGERVHLIGHVPPGTNECNKQWAQAYQKIISRYRQVITGQFFGHMHYDMFMIDFEPNGTVPTGVQIAGPAATTYDTGYPSYRIMHFGQHTEALEWETYHLNISELNEDFLSRIAFKSEDEIATMLDTLDSNDTSYLHWKLAYKMRDMYDMVDLSPSSFFKLADRIEKDNAVLRTYFRAFYQFREDVGDLHCAAGLCNDTFAMGGKEHDVVCEMYSFGSSQRDDCMKKYEKNTDPDAGTLPLPSVILTISIAFLVAFLTV